MTIKILFLVANLNNVGGIEKYNKGFLRALKESGVNVTTVELYKSAPFFKISFALRACLSALFSAPDIVIASHVNFSPLCLFLKNFFGKDYLIETYGIDVWNLQNPIRIRGLKGAKLILTVAHYTGRKMIEQIPELESKIIFMPNFVHAESFVPKEKSIVLLDSLSFPRDAKIILTVGRLSSAEQYKGYDRVIEAMPSIIKELPNTYYVIVGRGNDAARVHDLIKQMKLESRVMIASNVSDKEIVDYYNLCDVFAMPSRAEGFATVFLEALACGKPVIAGNQDGSHDPLLEGKLGILVNPDNTKEIAEAIIGILKKRVSANLLDSYFLHSEMLKAYGFDAFKARIKSLLGELNLSDR